MSRDCWESNVPTLLQDINACVSDALDALERGDTSAAIGFLEIIRDPVREKIGEIEDENGEG